MEPSQLALKAVEIIKSQVGKQESPKGSNWGHPVQDYLASVGIAFPASWCMALVYWCFEEASNALNTRNTAIRNGGCLNVWRLAPKASRSSVPSIGSVVIFDHGKGFGHTGIVWKIEGDKIFTVEGNTNDTGSREGFEVEYKDHLISNTKIVGYVNF